MIKGSATSVICFISPVQQIKENFAKRDVVLNDSWVGQDGTTHENYVNIEFTGERMKMLDLYEVGNKVVIEFHVTGRKVQNGKVYNTLRGLNITTYQNQWTPQAQQAYAPQGGYTPQPAQQQAAQPQAVQQQVAQQSPQPISPAAQQTIQQLGTMFGQPFVQDGVTPMSKNDLPF